MERGRTAFGLATAALAWSVVISVAAFIAPAYSGESCGGSSSGPTVCTHSTQTFVGVNGVHAVLWLALVAAVTGAGWLLLHAKCAFGMPGAAGLAQLCAGALLVFSLISFGMGLYVVPIPVLLFAASVRTPQGTHSAPR
jgi:hypothetical protein